MKKFLGYKSRSIWKGFSYKNILNNSEVKRAYTIKYLDIGKDVFFNNGKKLAKMHIHLKYVGKKFGQFLFTKKLGYKIHLNSNVAMSVNNKNKNKSKIKKKSTKNPKIKPMKNITKFKKVFKKKKNKKKIKK